MAEKVFKPASKYSPQFNTPVVQAQAYTKTFNDYLRENGKLISGFKSLENNTGALYVVPEHYVFYLVALGLGVVNNTTTSISTNDILLNNETIFSTTVGRIDGSCGNNSVSFSIPIKMVAGDELSLDTNRAGVWARATYIGYLISDIIPQ